MVDDDGDYRDYPEYQTKNDISPFEQSRINGIKCHFWSDIQDDHHRHPAISTLH